MLKLINVLIGLGVFQGFFNFNGIVFILIEHVKWTKQKQIRFLVTRSVKVNTKQRICYNINLKWSTT